MCYVISFTYICQTNVIVSICTDLLISVNTSKCNEYFSVKIILYLLGRGLENDDNVLVILKKRECKK